MNRSAKTKKITMAASRVRELEQKNKVIESTIRNSINDIIESFHNNQITCKNSSEAVKTIWINQELRNLNAKKIDINDLRAKVVCILDKIVREEILTFKDTCITISGNLDAKKIREIAKIFGYAESKNGSDLERIKTHRNNLAHGTFTFSDIGKQYAMNDLIKFKEETEKYLKDVLSKIDLYLKNKVFSGT